MRQILHVDMDAFYVSVEELENPSLKGKPVIVGADPGGRGVVAAASYEARKYGVHSAQPIGKAERLCPHAIFLRGHYDKYQEYSGRLCRIFGEFTPQVAPVSVDEAYLDLTGCEKLHGSMLRAANALIQTVKERTGLNCSVGGSTSRLVSKIASDQAKPHGLLYIFPGYEKQFLAPLPVRRIPGVGKVTEPRLQALGVRTIGDLQKLGSENLKQRLGTLGEWLYTKAQGMDIEAYQPGGEEKSLSHETTFEADTADREELERALSHLAQRVGRRLRAHGVFARTIGIKLRYSNFQTLTRETSLEEPTQEDFLIFRAALKLFGAAYDSRRKVRLLGVRATHLEVGVAQPGLLDHAEKDRRARLLEVADRLRDRFGFSAVQLARSLEPEKRKD